MIIPVATVVVILSVVLVGGRLRNLAGVRLRAGWLVLPALAVQIAIVELPLGPQWALRALHVLTYLTAAVVIWANRRIPGVLAVAAGAACNGTAIALNGGVLPARAQALQLAGIEGRTHAGLINSGVVADAKLPWLGDIFAIPASWPLANVFSIGDVLIVLGAGYASYRICGTWLTPAWNARAHGHARGGRHSADPPPRPDGGPERRESQRRSGERRQSERRAAREAYAAQERRRPAGNDRRAGKERRSTPRRGPAPEIAAQVAAEWAQQQAPAAAAPAPQPEPPLTAGGAGPSTEFPAPPPPLPVESLGTRPEPSTQTVPRMVQPVALTITPKRGRLRGRGR